MKFNRIIAAGLLSAAMLAGSAAEACTNFLFTKGATKDGSTMITYAADSQLVFVHVAYNAVGLGDLRNHDEGRAAVPVDDLEHGAGGIARRAAVVELAVERVTVGGIGDKGTAVGRGTAAHNQVGAGGSRQAHSQQKHKNQSFHHIN